jgi:hypothetical protein
VKRGIAIGTASVLLVLSLSACAGSASSSPSAPSLAPTRKLIQVQTRDRDRPVLPWTLVKKTSREIVVSATKKGCTVPHDIVVSETGTAVTLTVEGTRVKDPCTQEGFMVHITAKLESDLGQRKLLAGT